MPLWLQYLLAGVGGFVGGMVLGGSAGYFLGYALWGPEHDMAAGIMWVSILLSLAFGGAGLGTLTAIMLVSRHHSLSRGKRPS